jgi:transcriptional regulator
MYIPKFFKQENPEEVKSFLQQNSFGILVSTVDGKPWATHIPLELGKNEKGEDVLQGHMARGNKQWREFNKHEQVLAIFTGPHAYISSSWYDHENVPTWNYVAVHVYGELRIIEGDELLVSLKKLVNKYEANSTHPVKVENISAKFLESELRGIVGFEIRITNIQAAFKLSQNRDEKNLKNIVTELEKRGDAQSLQIAEQMKKSYKR